MRITMTSVHNASWRSVKMPFTVPLVDDGTGVHQDLRWDFFTVDHHAWTHRRGIAVLIRHGRDRTVYWTWRRPRGAWSADARRRHGKMTLVGFFDVTDEP